MRSARNRLTAAANGFLALLTAGACSHGTMTAPNATGSAPDCHLTTLVVAADYGPTWSPDGREIAFVHGRRSDSDSSAIDIVDVADGSLKWSFGLGDPFAQDLQWSPDGRRIALYYFGDVWTVDIASGMLRRWTFASPFTYYPTWSPDGRYILCGLVQRHFGDPDSMGGLHLIDTRDGSSRALLHDSNIPTYSSCSARFSPDGRSIALATSTDSGDSYEIYTVNVDGTDYRRITSMKGSALDPQWSADGTTLWFDFTPAPCSPVGSLDRGTWTVAAAGGTPRQVAVNLGDPRAQFGFPFELSPGGRDVAYVGVDSSGSRSVIWTARTDGSARRPLTRP